MKKRKPKMEKSNKQKVVLLKRQRADVNREIEQNIKLKNELDSIIEMIEQEIQEGIN